MIHKPDSGSQTPECDPQALVARAREADIHSQQRVLGSRIFGELADCIEALADQIARLTAENERLAGAGQALVDRWDSPLWGGSAVNLRHTGEYISELRAALAERKGTDQ